MTASHDHSVELLLHDYPPLTDAVRPLAELCRQNPSMTEDLIRFAMALGIRAADRHWQTSLTPPADRRKEDKPRLAWPDREEGPAEG